MKPKAGGRTRAYPGHIRIIGGIWRSRRLPVPEGEGLRPTPDRVRETLFNWLQPMLAGAHCLDLFAGSGALCLEALSRGAGQVVMVERAAHAAAALRRNLEALHAERAEVVCTDAVAFLSSAPASGGLAPSSFDIIFIDPPFASDLIARCTALVEEHNWLKLGGLAYIEAPRHIKSLSLPQTWDLVRSKFTGQVGYHLARRAALSDREG